MSRTYKAIGWNRQKKIYDSVLLAAIGLYLLAFVGVGLATHREATVETLLIRAFGTAALALLHVALSIGPLARLDRRFLPLLYNRRHLGVATFLLGLAHGAFSLVQFHALGNVNPLVSLLSANPRFDSLSHFPFQPLGLAALGILFLMAATSHDFWLAQLTAPVWKRLHMAVYLAYGLLIAHVALGVLQSETQPGFVLILAAGVSSIVGLHLLAGWRERRGDRPTAATTRDDWVEVCRVTDIPVDQARTICLGGERIAIFRYDGKISALSNACQHQNGPLGEGRVINGCVVCPWHGYEYDPVDGASPPPFTERVPTFNVRVVDARVWVDPHPNPPGTRTEPANLVYEPAPDAPGELYIGYQPRAPAAVSRHLRWVVVALLVIAPLAAAALVALQSPFAEAHFEYGSVREFEGILRAAPYPTLAVNDPADLAGTTMLLTEFGKEGADARAAPFEGRQVRLRGQLIHRGDSAMLELAPSAIEDLGTGAGLDVPTAFGEQALIGEIVDSKCHLGVMKPGDGKPHRGCAVRCISGGAPPILWVRDQAGEEAHYLLVGRDGRQLGQEILDLVAEPVEVRGKVARGDDLWLVHAEPTDIARITTDDQ